MILVRAGPARNSKSVTELTPSKPLYSAAGTKGKTGETSEESIYLRG